LSACNGLKRIAVAQVSMPYRTLADAVLALHVLVVAFVVGGLLAVLAGNLLGWRWVNNAWFRRAHVAAIGIVVVVSWLGEVCPLTTLESWLRVQAGASGYDKGFIEHWLQAILFYEGPTWAFVLAYTAFGLLVVLAWWRFPPRRDASR
jgi:hypothetical protein